MTKDQIILLRKSQAFIDHAFDSLKQIREDEDKLYEAMSENIRNSNEGIKLNRQILLLERVIRLLDKAVEVIDEVCE